MAMEIVKVYRESMPAVRLIGKCYGDGDRNANGSFGPKWDEWMANQWFDPLFLSVAEMTDGDATLGFMRFTKGVFEYWIGLFCKVGTPVPEGYAHLDLDPAEMAICWVQGSMDSGEIFGEEPCMQSIKTIEAEGWKIAPDSWFCERYADTRFLEKDAEGKVILDYCFHLAP